MTINTNGRGALMQNQVTSNGRTRSAATFSHGKRQYEPPKVTLTSRRVSEDPLEIRILDKLGAVAMLVLFGPLMALIATLIYISNPGPIIFKQRRIGRSGLMFECYKFRTMVTDAEERLESVLEKDPEAKAEWERDHKLRNDPRIIGIGSFLRKSSLDELPQILNILKGEMSLVGPRPIVAAERVKYGRYFPHYCSVRPGLTGLWQISGRNDVNYRRRVAYDVLFARKSRTNDYLAILLKTVPSVIASRGSY